MNKLDQSENKKIKKNKTKKKDLVRSKSIPDVQFKSIPINFNDVIKGGKTINHEE